jgi:hypothetical protein
VNLPSLSRVLYVIDEFQQRASDVTAEHGDAEFFIVGTAATGDGHVMLTIADTITSERHSITVPRTEAHAAGNTLRFAARSFRYVQDLASKSWMSVSGRHWGGQPFKIRMREPPELDFPSEKPTLMPKLLSLHLEELGYSVAQLASMLVMHEDELMSFYDIRPNPPNGRPRLRIVS